MKTLRELAKDHAQGKLKQADYRQCRVDLINGILAGEIEVKDHVFKAPPPPLDEDITEQSGFDPLSTTKMATVPNFNIDSDITEPDASAASNISKPAKVEPEVKTDKPLQNKIIWLLVSTTVVLIIVIVLTILMLRSGLDEASTGAQNETQVQAPPLNSPTDQLISDFLAANNWQTENLNEFVRKWQQFSHEDRQKAMSSSRLAQLSNTIYKKILAEKALHSLGGSESNEETHMSLIKFAKSIGINDPKIISQPE